MGVWPVQDGFGGVLFRMGVSCLDTVQPAPLTLTAQPAPLPLTAQRPARPPCVGSRHCLRPCLSAGLRLGDDFGDDRDDDVDVNTLEQQHMQVTIELAGHSYAQTLERNSAIPVVSVYGLSVSNGIEEQVNITDFKIFEHFNVE